MTEMRFPADRTAYVSSGPYEPILVPPPTAYVVCTDALCTLLATIKDLLGVVIADSRIVTDQDGLFPEWTGPNGTERLYGRPSLGTGPILTFDANYSDRIDALGTGSGTYATFAALATASTADRARANHTGTQDVGTITGLTSASVGLGNLDNTADFDKPLSSIAISALSGKAATSHTHLASGISDASTIGRSILTAADASAVQSLIGASGLALGYGPTQAKPGDWLPTWNDVAFKPVSFPPTAHGHAQSEVTGLVSDLAAKAPLVSPAFTGTATFAGPVTGLTKATVGLANLDNTSDASKPLSTATSAALAAKAALVHLHAIGDVTGLQGALDGKQAAGAYTTITDLGPIFIAVADRSNHTGTQLASTISNLAAVATSGNYADLTGTVPASALPALAINETSVVASQAAMLALVAQRGDMAIRSDTSQTYVLSSDDPTTLANWVALLSPGQVQSVAGRAGNVVLTKADVGLANLDNTSDVSKPLSTAVITALAAKAPLASPAFTGTVTGITKAMVGLALADNTTDLDKPLSLLSTAALLGKAATSHTHNVIDLADASSIGRQVLTSIDAPTIRTILGVSSTGTPGLPGPPGPDAYADWLSQGFTGTIDVFLNSLVGVAGPAGRGGIQKTVWNMDPTTVNTGDYEHVIGSFSPSGDFLLAVRAVTDQSVTGGGVLNVVYNTSGSDVNLFSGGTEPTFGVGQREVYVPCNYLMAPDSIFAPRLQTAVTAGGGTSPSASLVGTPTIYTTGSGTTGTHSLISPSGGTSGDKIYLICSEQSSNTLVVPQDSRFSQILRVGSAATSPNLSLVIFETDYVAGLNMVVNTKDPSTLVVSLRSLSVTTLIVRASPTNYQQQNVVGSGGNTTGPSFGLPTMTNSAASGLGLAVAAFHLPGDVFINPPSITGGPTSTDIGTGVTNQTGQNVGIIVRSFAGLANAAVIPASTYAVSKLATGGGAGIISNASFAGGYLTFAAGTSVPSVTKLTVTLYTAPAT